MTTIKGFCKQYFDFIRHPTSRQDKKGKALTTAALLSCIIPLIPAGLGAIYGIAKLVDKIKNGRNTPTETKVKIATSQILGSIPHPSSSSNPHQDSIPVEESSSEEPEQSPPQSVKLLEEKKHELRQLLFTSKCLRSILIEENREALTAIAKENYSLTLSDLLKAMEGMEKPSENKLLIDLIEMRIHDFGSWFDISEKRQLSTLLFVLPEHTLHTFLGDGYCLKNLTSEQKETILKMPPDSFLPKALLMGVLKVEIYQSSPSEELLWVNDLSKAIWEAAFAEIPQMIIDEINVWGINKFIKIYFDKELSILRGTLKNPCYKPKNIVSGIRNRFSPDEPAQIVRDIGAANLLNFPWNQYIHEFIYGRTPPTFIQTILPQLDMTEEEDVAILNAMGKSPLFDEKNDNPKFDFLNLISPEQREKLVLDEVHEKLRMPLRLFSMPIEELYEAFKNNSEETLDTYQMIGRPRFTELFAYICTQDSKALPDSVLTMAKRHFKNPTELAKLKTKDQILRAGHLLENEEFDKYFLRQLVPSFGNQSIENVRALEQLLAEKQLVILDDAFDYYQCNRDEEFYNILLRHLVEKLDDPFLLTPILVTNGQVLPNHGPLGTSWAAQIWHKQAYKSFGLYTDLMKSFEKEPWKFALMLEDRSAFDTDVFNRWFTAPETSKPNDLELPILLEWNKWLKTNEGTERREIHDALKEAVEEKKYADIKGILEKSPQAKQIFTAAILGPTPETVAHRIHDYSEKQLAAALSTEEGKERLKPHLGKLLLNEKLSWEFKTWILSMVILPQGENQADLFDNSKGEPKPDLIVKVNDQTFSLHKEILNDASKWFENKLAFNPDASEYIIELGDDINPLAVEHALRYMYSKEMPEFEDDDSFKEFYKALVFLGFKPLALL